ncbi:brca2 repeat-containing protein [Cyclospora cayetanensis]|uniref:Brca2 repeat-containing protein n=1 Tax=Cyclospora cayetanensis TaxID=88456 RepID=A0A1D3D360_9EIME|nr:brca2 repeat-containing protein [Cyclospora cayetanensis]
MLLGGAPQIYQMFCCALREQQEQKPLFQHPSDRSETPPSSSSASLARFGWRWFANHFRLLAFFGCLRWRQQCFVQSQRLGSLAEKTLPPPPSPLTLLRRLLVRAAREAEGWRSALRRICEGDTPAAIPLAVGVVGWRITAPPGGVGGGGLSGGSPLRVSEVALTDGFYWIRGKPLDCFLANDLGRLLGGASRLSAAAVFEGKTQIGSVFTGSLPPMRMPRMLLQGAQLVGGTEGFCPLEAPEEAFLRLSSCCCSTMSAQLPKGLGALRIPRAAERERERLSERFAAEIAAVQQQMTQQQLRQSLAWVHLPWSVDTEELLKEGRRVRLLNLRTGGPPPQLLPGASRLPAGVSSASEGACKPPLSADAAATAILALERRRQERAALGVYVGLPRLYPTGRTLVEAVGPSPIPPELLAQQLHQQPHRQTGVPLQALPLLLRLPVLSESHLLACGFAPHTLRGNIRGKTLGAGATAPAAAEEAEARPAWAPPLWGPDLPGGGAPEPLPPGAPGALGLTGGLPYDLVGLLLHVQQSSSLPEDQQSLHEHAQDKDSLAGSPPLEGSLFLMTGGLQICCVQLRGEGPSRGHPFSAQVDKFLEPARAALQLRRERQEGSHICICIEGIEFERYDLAAGFWIFKGVTPLLQLSLGAVAVKAVQQQPLLAKEASALHTAAEAVAGSCAFAGSTAHGPKSFGPPSLAAPSRAADLVAAAAAAHKRVLRVTLDASGL